MFSRKEQTYLVDNETLGKILRDPAQPLGQIVKILPEGATVLDIGAGNGMLGRVLQQAGKQMTIDGIEPNEFAATLAKPFYRTVYQGYAQDYAQMIQSTHYDYVVLADVIEHIPNPAVFLAELIPHFQKTTKLIISMPNVAFGGVRLALLNGFFDYVDSGLLERTHLRFFTLISAQRLFEEQHLYSERILSLERSFYRVEFSRESLRASPFTVLSLANKSDARAYQYLFVLASKPSRSNVMEHYGITALNILIDAIIVRTAIKKLVHRWRNR
jgi:2-polyprenyl-3-methyl-5-hydroxy-6-metoxy-1,4-benzoquinol methylase